MLNPLLLLRVYNHLYVLTDMCVKNAVYLWETVVQAYSIKTYILFNGIAYPYNRALVNIGILSSATPLWYYREDTRTFVEWSLQFQNMDDAQRSLQARELPILSMAVVDEERIIHDLTDFLGPIRVVHSSPTVFPSIAHIVGAWSLSSGIILNPSKQYLANSITSSADTIAIPIDSHEYFNPVIDDSNKEIDSVE